MSGLASRVSGDGPLFNPPPSNGTGTSDAAAKRKRSTAERDRDRVLAALKAAGERGLTDEEIQIETRLDGNSERPRRQELQRAGLIAATNHKRRTVRGSLAMVWRVQP